MSVFEELEAFKDHHGPLVVFLCYFTKYIIIFSDLLGTPIIFLCHHENRVQLTHVLCPFSIF